MYYKNKTKKRKLHKWWKVKCAQWLKYLTSFWVRHCHVQFSNLDMYIKSQDMEKSSAKCVIINLAVFIYTKTRQSERKNEIINYQPWQNTLKTNNSLEKDAHTSFYNATSHLYVWNYMLVWGRRAFIRSSGLVCPVTGRLCWFKIVSIEVQ